MNITHKSLVIAAVSCALTQSSSAELLSYWNFNNIDPVYNSGTLGSFDIDAAAYGEAYSQVDNATPGTLASNTSNSTVFNGAGINIDFANIATIANATINGKAATSYTSQNITGGNAGYGVFTDSTLNRVGTDSTTGGSLIFLNPSANMNGKYITLSLSSVGYDTLSLTYATRRTSGMNARDVWTYSTDGIVFSDLSTPGYTNGTSSFATTTLNISTLSSNVLDNQSTFYLRLNFDSSSTTGSYAYDNIQLTGSTIPEPTTAALFMACSAGGVLLRRRRRA
ncbi:PEP-CTERM sorting domain-containing protein [Cerasicoccus arenae]|uniref:PEP-CTERM sorting domain-containing protein n=1 Tax=Cerasicoccus arenae TaxID=424488 RepID=A0A8J3DE76_9BACT|nr:PEP-CTERM sorting domain-containing protein [Cerasicoccus arenae]MBK1858352.1 PEP-CTERM sorting domain-containing protein [Cerasicoccus arenae]GHC09750.1 hypothetical protein GCM10007047_28810 [Cerasicoccus arenae]